MSFAERLDDRARKAVLALAHLLRQRADPAIIELIPAAVTLGVRYRVDLVDFATLKQSLTALIGGEPPPDITGRLIEIPVRYDGPDLPFVAETTGLPISDVIARHCGREYEVLLLGFVPGFGYLTPLDPRLVLPRRAAPRPRVPAGSVAIAGDQTGIYPAATPGGWHLIGRTEVSMFDPRRDPPGLLSVGDRVRFVEMA